MGAKVGVASQSYDDPDVATHVADANCDELVKSLDPLSFALKLVSRGLVVPQQAREILYRAKTVSDRNSAFLNLIKSSPDPTWFATLLEALGEERTTERLKEVLKKSYVDWERRHGLRRVPHTATPAASDQKGRSSSSQLPASKSVADEAAFQEPPSYSDTGPMKEWNRAALVSLQGDLKLKVIIKTPAGLSDKLQKAAGGFMDEGEAQAVESKPSSAEQMGELIRILLGKGNADFRTFCTMLRESNYSVWADELERKAREFRGEPDGSAPQPGPFGTDVSAQKVHDNTALLHRKPSWTLLQKTVVPKVSSNWKAVGLNLDIKDSCLSAIEKSKPHQPDACCTEMFSMWLGLAPHTGDLPLTWSSVLSAVGKVDGATSEELLAELKSGVGAHLATLKLADELETYYNRLEPVVGDEFTPKLEFVELAVVKRQEYGLRKKKKFEEFLHATVNGIDEIYEKSHPMEYCQILTLEKGPTPGKHIIVSGAPGSGKTTLVRKLCKDLSSGRLRSGYTLVVLVELRELILLLQDKEEAQLHHFFAKFKHRVDISQVCRELKESDGRGVLLVLDGFDELDARMRRCQLLKKLLSAESIYLPDCDILVTTRPVTCPDLLGLTQPLHRHIEILGFSEDRIASFIRSYFKCTCQPPPSQPAPSQMSAEGECEAEKLLSRLAQLPQVKGMCRTPVVLKIVCVVCQILGADDLPATMTGIYEEFIRRQLLENGPQGTVVSSILQVPSSDYPFFSDLCRIAFECCTKQKLTISREDIGSTSLPFTRGTIYGLLFEDRVADLRAIRGLALYHFMHKTMQEALAACHLAALPDPKSREEVWKEWFGRPEMAEVWKFYSGLTGLKCVDISSILPLAAKADEAVRTLLVISLFEAGNASLAREELPRIFPQKLVVCLRTSYETAVYAFALQHHPSLEKLILKSLTTGSVNLQLLLDALSHHPTVRELHVQYIARMEAEDRAALCQFLRGKHRLAKVELNVLPVEVAVAALSTESSTMEELRWLSTIHVGDDATGNLLDCLRSTSLRCITIRGTVGEVLLPILRGLAANTKTVDRTVGCLDDFPLHPSSVSQLAAELRQFLVPCVNCVLTMPLPVGVWGSFLSGVGDARQLERLRVNMLGKPEGAGPEWDHIDQLTLEEVEKSWAHSWCREVQLDISGGISSCPVQGSTLDATMKLLCAVVRGIIQRKDQFVFELRVVYEQVSRLVELEDIAKNKCAVTRTESYERDYDEDDFMEYTLTVLELKPLSSDQNDTSDSDQNDTSDSDQDDTSSDSDQDDTSSDSDQDDTSPDSSPPAKRSLQSSGVQRKRKKESSSSQPSSKD